MFKIGDEVIYVGDTGHQAAARVVEVDPTSGNPYCLSIPYHHSVTGRLMHFTCWVAPQSVMKPPSVKARTLDDEIKACQDYYKKTYEETPEEAYDRAMGVL